MSGTITGTGIVPGGALGAELQNLVRRVFTNAVMNLTSQASPTLALLLRNAKMVGGGLNPITQPVQVSGYTSANWMGPDGSFALPAEQTGEVNAQFNLAAIAAAVPHLGLETLVSGGADALISRLELKLNDLTTQTIAALSNGVFDAGGQSNSNAMLGLYDAYDDGTNVGTYGGISRTTYPAWKSTLKTAAGAILTRAKFLPMMLNVVQNSKGIAPDFGIMSLADWTTLLTDFMSVEQYITNPGSRYGADDAVNAGFRGLMLGDVPLYFDLYCPAGTAFILNSRYLNTYVHDDANFAWTGWYSTIPTGQVGSVGLMITALNLICNNPASGMQVQGITGGVV